MQMTRSGKTTRIALTTCAGLPGWARDLQVIRGGLSGKRRDNPRRSKATYPNPQAVLDVTLDSPGLVVLADIFYPGWDLKIDGKPAADLPGQRCHAGGPGPDRSSSASLYLRPQSFRLGLQVSIVALAAFLILGLAWHRWPDDPVLA